MIKFIIFCNVLINIRLSYILDSLHTTEVVQAFYCYNIDDFGLKVKKNQKSLSQKISIFHPTNKRKVFLIQKKVNLQIIMFSYALNTWSGIRNDVGMQK